jgi:DNA-binding transcriptional LysR family regulator
MLLRQLEYLLALARERHFGRAADQCGVSQPALSNSIRQLEAELGIPIIHRGQRFVGLTPEGQKILAWAAQVVHHVEGIRQEAASAREALSGTLRIGAIPTTIPILPLLARPFLQDHQGVDLRIYSLSASELARDLDACEIDLAVSYTENEQYRGFEFHPLYRERYVLINRGDTAARLGESVSWREAAQLPLCLLTPNMQNRQIIDSAFRKAGATPRVQISTDSIFSLYAHVRLSDLAAIVPHSLLFLYELREELIVTPVEPALERGVALFLAAKSQDLPLVAAFRTMASEADLQSQFDRLLTAIY